jgi:hypothetical protein
MHLQGEICVPCLIMPTDLPASTPGRKWRKHVKKLRRIHHYSRQRGSPQIYRQGVGYCEAGEKWSRQFCPLTPPLRRGSFPKAHVNPSIQPSSGDLTCLPSLGLVSQDWHSVSKKGLSRRPAHITSNMDTDAALCLVSIHEIKAILRSLKTDGHFCKMKLDYLFCDVTEFSSFDGK